MQSEKKIIHQKRIIMKKIFTLFAAMALTVLSYAQPANGSFASDFSLYEIDKATGTMLTDHTINLYGMLNDYKTVYIDVSATTCGPCLTFHQGGTLDNIYNSYGPNSAVNDSRVLFIEGASTGSSWPAINGSAGSNYWDCTHVYGSTTELVPYPVIPLRLSPNYVSNDGSCNYYTFHNDYNIGAFPTVFMVCPNRMVYDLYGVVSSNATTYHNQVASKCPAWDNANDAMFSLEDLNTHVCYCDHPFAPKVILQNVGTAPLTSAVLHVTCGPDAYDHTWTGNLNQFEMEEVTLTPFVPTQEGNVTINIQVAEANGVADAGTKYNSFSTSVNVQKNSNISTAVQQFTTTSLDPWALEDNTDGLCGRFLAALRFRAYKIHAGGTAELYAPLMNFTNNQEPTLTFDVAHVRYSSSSERLQVMVSSDCGTTWTVVYDKAGEELATGPASSSEFNTPSAYYRQEIVDLSDYAGEERVLIKFVFTSDYGNNVFVDNINISNGPTAIETVEVSNLEIFPNPVKDVLTINYDKAISQIDVYDLDGKLVKSFTTVGSTVNVSDLSAGVYMLNMQTEEGLVVKKIVKE